MTARVSMIRHWIERGQERGAAYMMTWYDPLGREDYPTYHKDAESVNRLRNEAKQYDEALEEVYDLNGDIDEQIATRNNTAI